MAPTSSTSERLERYFRYDPDDEKLEIAYLFFRQPSRPERRCMVSIVLSWWLHLVPGGHILHVALSCHLRRISMHVGRHMIHDASLNSSIN